MPRIVVVGGGVAGIAAALAARRAGVQVVLFESQPRLGGRVAGADRLDTGRHLVLTGYHAFLRLLRLLGSDHELRLQPLRYTALGTGRRATMPFQWGSLPAPLAPALNLLGTSLLPPADRPAALLALAATVAAAPGEPPAAVLRGDPNHPRFRRSSPVSVAGMFTRFRWPDSLVQRLGIPLAMAMGNADPEDLSAGLFLNALARVFTDPEPFAGWVVGERFGAVISDPAEHVLRRWGVDVHLGEGVQSVERSGDRWRVTAGSETVADGLLVTASPARLGVLEGVDDAGPLLRWAEQQRGSGILTLRARVRDIDPWPGPLGEATAPHAVWFAEAYPKGGVLLERVVSGLANDEVRAPDPWTAEFAELARTWFGAGVQPEQVTVRWFPDATASLVPGGFRPVLRQGAGLYYASDLSATALPATLESAARAGFHAGWLLADELRRQPF